MPLLDAPPTTPPMQWRQILRNNFTRLEELCAYLELSEFNQKLLLTRPRFSLNVPRRLAAKMEKNTLTDPLFLQFVPLSDETNTSPGFVSDPVCDLSFRKGGKVLHKYRGRALVLATSACAMHCRYCFRQNFPYEKGESDIEKDLALLLQTEEPIEEIILSGGDPLSLSNERLEDYLNIIDRLPSIKRIRFHTRFPIGIPERLDASFLKLLSSVTKPIYFVIHCNHPRELDPEVLASLRSVAMLGIPLLNQSVLLKGVNDNEEVFLELCETLVNGGILPYYLHLLDPVVGAGHFDVPESRGRQLIEYVQKRLSGYGVPRLVREEPGELSKTIL